ncbi:MAG: hypothetical protein MK212_07165 [Saprospiraceae bacterium]|nr:hypothetical protein [Saprospiraceae bacterium]
MSRSTLPILFSICLLFLSQTIFAQNGKYSFSDWKYSIENFPDFYHQSYLNLEFRPLNADFSAGVLNYTSPDPLFLSFSESTPSRKRSLAVLLSFDQELVLANRFLLRYGSTLSLNADHHLEYMIGLGDQQQIYKKRPIFIRVLLQYSYWNYAVRMGNIQNDSLKLMVNDRELRASNLNIFIGNRVNSMRAILGFSIDIIPNISIYAEGSYLILSSNRSRVFFKQNGGLPLLKRKSSLPLTDPSLDFTQNGVPTSQVNIVGSLALKIGITIRNVFDR